MKSLATITESDIDTIKIALNDSISDINNELKGNVKQKTRVELLDYKEKENIFNVILTALYLFLFVDL